MDIVEVAQRIADEVLFPAALATDASDVVPRELLDALAGAGLYGLAAPEDAAGLSADFPTVCAVQEALASGCLTTAFVWAQHNGLVRALAEGGRSELTATWLAPLARGEIRAGVALAGLLPRPPLRARPDAGGWRLDGVAPFVSGWGRIDVIHVAARAGDEIVWLLVDAAEGPSVRAERLKLAALNATDAELASLRAELDRPGPGTAAARAAAGELALRAASALMTTQGSRSLLVAEHGQRLAREALFILVYALRPASRDALLARLGAPEPA